MIYVKLAVDYHYLYFYEKTCFDSFRFYCGGGLLIVCADISFADTSQIKHTLKDFGLSEESVKYLSPKEIEGILNSHTPEETKKIEMEKIAKESNASSTFVGQSIPRFPSLNSNPNAKNLKDVVNCFDYYHFGSIQTDISSESSNAVPGMIMQFTGTVKNENQYPIVGGTLFVKIFKEKGREKDANGPDVIDQFIAMDNVSIPANAFLPTSFSWSVPLYARGGDYRIASFFITDKKFNLLGLSFTDDVTGNTFDFHIEAKDSTVYFDKTSVKINDAPYFFAAFPPRMEDKNSANVSAQINNSTDKEETVNVIWKLYHWDGVNPENFIRTITTSSAVKAHSSSRIKITIPDKDFPVYYLVGELAYKDAKSILGIRFVRSGVDRVRLNFPSIMDFPIKKGATATMFSCVHNSGTSPIVPDNKIVLEIKDDKGETVDRYVYEGPITGEMMAVKKDFVSPKNLDNFSLRAEVWHSGKIVDQSTIVYDCHSIDLLKCNPKEDNKIIFIVFGIAALLLIALGFGVYKKKMKHKALLLILLLLPFGFFFSSSVTEAKSVSWNNAVYNNDLYYFLGGYWSKALSSIDVTVNYNVEIRNTTPSVLIPDGSSVPVGADLILKFLPHIYTDIYWFGIGYSGDSPYGEWREDAAPPVAVTCETKDYTYSYYHPGTTNFAYYVYIPLVVSPPIKKIANTSNMSCGSLSGDGVKGYSMKCKVTQAGSLTPEFNFDSTFGKFYYRYFDPIPVNYVACFGNNIPLNLKIATNFDVYQLDVPPQTIRYDLTAVSVSNNRPPLSPTITGPTTGYTGQSYTFNFVSTDPDNDTIKYGIDWSEPSDGLVDQWLPVIGYVNSGTQQSANKSWAGVGQHSFRAVTVDSKDAQSGWAIHTVNLTNPPSSSSSSNSSSSSSSSSSGSGSSSSSGGGASSTSSSKSNIKIIEI